MKSMPGAGISAAPLTIATLSIFSLLFCGCQSPAPIVEEPAPKTQIVLTPAPAPGARPFAPKPAATAKAPETAAEFNAMLEKKPELAKNPEFIQRYTQAQAREFYFAGRKSLDQGDWQQAIASFEKSLTVNRQQPEVLEILKTTRTAAAKDFHSRAIKSATGGDLIRALQWMDKAVESDPDSPEMAKARKTLAVTSGASQAEQAWRESVDLEKDGRRCEALKKSDAVLAADPQHLAALAARFRLRPLIVQARQKLVPVSRDIAEGDIDEAEADLAMVETLCRDLPELLVAKVNLAKIKTEREQILHIVDDLAAAGRWDEALAKIKEAKAIATDTTQLNKKAQEIRKIAANSYRDTAFKLLKEQHYAEAKKQLRQGAAFLNENEARDLWQQFWIEGGGFLDRKGHAGAAYLWYAQGVSLKPDPEVQVQINDLTAIIMRHFSYRIVGNVTIAEARLQIESDLLKQMLEAELKKLPSSWSIVATNPATAGRSATLNISVSDIRMDAEPRFFRKATQTRNYTKADGERGRWEYTVEEYRKTGEVRYAVKLANGGQNIAQPAQAIWNWYVADQIIDRPNPSLGLNDAVLNLPANDEFRSQLLQRFISIQLNNAMAAIFENQIAALELEASKTQDMETYMDLRGAAYVLFLQSDQRRAASLLQDALKF